MTTVYCSNDKNKNKTVTTAINVLFCFVKMFSRVIETQNMLSITLASAYMCFYECHQTLNVQIWFNVSLIWPSCLSFLDPWPRSRPPFPEFQIVSIILFSYLSSRLSMLKQNWTLWFCLHVFKCLSLNRLQQWYTKEYGTNFRHR